MIYHHDGDWVGCHVGHVQSSPSLSDSDGDSVGCHVGKFALLSESLGEDVDVVVVLDGGAALLQSNSEGAKLLLSHTSDRIHSY
jgi:hypothetical protein